jgi:hypothetical protein
MQMTLSDLGSQGRLPGQFQLGGGRCGMLLQRRLRFLHPPRFRRPRVPQVPHQRLLRGQHRHQLHRQLLLAFWHHPPLPPALASARLVNPAPLRVLVLRYSHANVSGIGPSSWRRGRERPRALRIHAAPRTARSAQSDSARGRLGIRRWARPAPRMRSSHEGAGFVSRRGSLRAEPGGRTGQGALPSPP